MTAQPTLAPGAFAAKWRGVTTTEKAASQEHFIDLCRMIGEPTPKRPTRPARIFQRLSEASHAAARAGTGRFGPRGTGTAQRRIEYCWVTGNR